MKTERWAPLWRVVAIVVTLALVLQPNLSPQASPPAQAAELAAAPMAASPAAPLASLAAPLASIAAPGFAVSDFATGFPSSGVGPVGVAFDSNNTLLAMDYANGILYRFGAQGGAANASTQVNPTPISGAPAGLAFGKDGRLYVARQSASDVLELNPTNGAIVRIVATGVPCATGIATDPLSGDLFVSTVGCSANGVVRISQFASGPGTLSGYSNPGTADGLTFGPDGTLYAAIFGQSVVRIAGTNAPNPGAVTFIANVPSSDGTAVAAGSDPTRPPFIFANRNDGIISRIDLTTSPPTLSTVASGGTRGDFVSVGPDGCLYATQTSTIVKVTNADGTCSLAPTGAQPQLSLSPSNVSPSPSVGTPVTFAASLLNLTNPGGTQVTFTVTGANPQTATAAANSAGQATFTFAGANTGTDTLVATARPSNTQLTSNPGTVTWVRAEPHSLVLSGASNSFAESPSSPDLNLTSSWTVEFWLRDSDPNGFDHEFRYIINKGDGIDAESPFYLLLGNGNLLAGLRTNGRNNPLTYNLHAAGYSAKIWQHIAATFNGDTNTLRLFINGQQVGQQTLSAHSVNGNSLPLEIGRQGPTLGKYWLGSLDDLRIWNVERSSADIAANFRTQLSGPRSGLVANWHFDEGCGATAADSADSHVALLSSGAGWSVDTPSAPQPGAPVTPSTTSCGGGGTATNTPTPTSTNTPTATATSTRTATATNTSTATPTSTATATATSTNTAQPAATDTPTATPTATATSTAQPTDTSTPTATSTATSTATVTSTATSAPTATGTATNTPTATATVTPTQTATATSTSTPQPTDTSTPTATSTATSTATVTSTATSTPTATSTATDTPTATPTVTPTQTATATSQPTDTATPTATGTSTNTPTATATSSPTPTATVTLTQTATSMSTSTATSTATPTATSTATSTATPTATSTITPTPTSTGISTPTATPTLTGCTPNPNPPSGTPPSVSISSPADGSSLAAPTVIRGSVSSATLTCWILSYTRSGTTTPTQLAAGSTPVSNNTLGTFDPTILINGSYRIDLTAIDSAGRSSITSIGVSVIQDLKVGNFTLTFTDFYVPVAGIPITVTRTYDSRNTAVGDFGAGWSLGIKNVRVEKSFELGANWQETNPGGFLGNWCVVPTKAPNVTITFSNGKAYLFQAMGPCRRAVPFGNGEQITMAFTQLPTTPGTEGATLTTGDNSPFVSGFSGSPGPIQLQSLDTQDGIWDPTAFTLTLADGTSYTVDQNAGLQNMRDSRGNTLTVDSAGIHHSSGKSLTFQRDSNNPSRITRITDPNGNAATYHYNAAGDLDSMVDQNENQHSISTGQPARPTTFSYNLTHGLLQITDPAGRNGIRNDYDSSGRLLSTTDANGHTITYSFDPNTRQELYTDRAGNTSVYVYDARGNTTSITDPNGNVTSATYDPVTGYKTSETDQLHQTTTFSNFDAHGNARRKVDAAGNGTTYTFDAHNNKTSETDANLHTTTYNYDLATNNLTSVMDALGNTVSYTYDGHGNVLTAKDPAGNTASFSYDPTGNNLLSKTDTLNHTTTYTYDSNGHQLSSTDPLNHITRVSYDSVGHPVDTTDAANTVTHRDYDLVGNLSTYRDQAGNQTQILSDTIGLPQQTTAPDGSHMAFTYDPNSNLSGATNPNGLTPSVTRNKVGNATGVAVAPGVSIGYGYDAKGRKTSETDARGNITTYTYNVLDKVTSKTDPANGITRYTYDGVGNLLTIQDPNGNVTTNTYDVANRLTRTTLPGGSTFIQYTYNNLGEMTQKRDAAGNVTNYSYDSEGNLLSVTDALTHTTSYTYDAAGNQLTITDALNHVTTNAYDARNHLARRTYPDSTFEQMTYNATGKLATMLDRKGQTTTYTYDTMNRVATVQYADGTSASYTYYAGGKRQTVTDARGTTTTAYDTLGNLTAETFPGGATLSYTYDANNNRASITTPDGTTRYAYDPANRMTSATDPRGLVTSYTYDSAGNLLTTTYPNGVVTTRAFDIQNRVSSITTRSSSNAVLFQETYTRDALGNRTNVANLDGSSIAYTYDALSRLATETHRNASNVVTSQISYTYDFVGNRITTTNGSTITTLTYNNLDQLTNDGTNTYSYDANGNTTRVTNGLGQTTYAYDNRNRLTLVTLPDGSTNSHQYDADGNRVQTRAGTSTTNYLVDAGSKVPNVVLETDGTGNVLAFYTYGIGLISQRRGTTDSFDVTDALGSVRLLTNSAGAVTDAYTYTSFGELESHTGSTQNSRLFTGEQFDSAAGLYYLRSRYYNPSAGRFLTADRFDGFDQDPRTLNRYAYTLNNPINATDPFGFYSTGQGNDIHRLIGEFYLGIWGDYFVSLGRRANRGFPAIGGFGAYNRGILNGGGAMRPDLRNYLTGDVYEIKPLTPYGVIEGPIDLADYVLALNLLEPGAPALGVWIPGIFSWPGLVIFPYAGGTVEVYGPPLTGPGLIFYTQNLVRDLALVAAVASAATLGYLAALRLIQLAPALIAAAEEAEFAEIEAGIALEGSLGFAF